MRKKSARKRNTAGNVAEKAIAGKPASRFAGLLGNGTKEGSRTWREPVDLAKGISTWMALYHYIEAPRAERFYELDLKGFGEEQMWDPDGPLEDRLEFSSNHHRWKEDRKELERQIYWALREGRLVAKGYNSNAPIDAPRQAIPVDRWKDLKLDMKQSIATGSGIVVTQLLVFDPRREKPEPARWRARVSPAALRAWYLEWIGRCEAERKIPTREDDFSEAKMKFADAVTRQHLRELRRELGPESWKKKGRRGATANRKGRDTSARCDTSSESQ